MNADDDRWALTLSLGVIAVVIGGAVLYGVVDDDPRAGMMLVLGAFIVSMGATLVVDEYRRWKRRRGGRRRER